MSEQLKTRQSRDSKPQKAVDSPTADDFKGKAIESAVLKESIQHPATIFPLAGSGLALGWALIIQPSPVSIAVSLGLAFVGATSFVYNYVVKGPERAVAYISNLREIRRTQTRLQLQQILDQCERLRFTDGAKEAKELQTAYDDLAGYLKESKEAASSDRFRLLADDSLRQGISTLDKAVAIFKAIGSIDASTLESEVTKWKSDLLALDAASPRAKSLNQQIESHTTRIDLYKQDMEKVNQLLTESNEIEGALQSTYLQLVDMDASGVDDFLREDGGAANKLKSAVEVAKRVEQRLRGGEDAELEAKKSKYLDVQEHST